MKVLKWLGLVLVFISVGGYAVNEHLVADSLEHFEQSQTSHVVAGKFANTEPVAKGSFWDSLKIAVRFFTEKKVDAEPVAQVPVEALSREGLLALSEDKVHIVRLGHSSVLLKVLGEFWLLDPVFGERASPFSFMGPKRFHKTPISIEDLPPIDKVLISHDHYDHLDKQAVGKLANKTKQFLVPLGVDAHLRKWGVDANKITSFDWWQEMQQGDNRVVFTPTRHFSGRGLTDANSSLWGSWVIDTPAGKLFFSGDSGYFSGFAEIGRRFGPFDVTFIETGAYDPLWPQIHMTPEESVQAHLDLRGDVMIPIHNGTFDLAFHAWYDPFERVLNEATRLGAKLSTPVVGQVIEAKSSLVDVSWWRELMPVEG